jgi:hypothetical protein
VTGIFAQFQPRYAERGIATFPVSSGKVPMIKGWPKVGLRGSTELATKFADVDAFGYVTGRRSNVTVLDIDTTDSKIAEDAIARHGQPRIVTRTASGKLHLLYRYNGERRRIRPFAGLPIDLLGDNGQALAAPSKIERGQYQIVHGHLDDLDRLTPMVEIEAPSIAPEDPSPEQSIPVGRRNTELWRWCMKHAHTCDNRMALVSMAQAYNEAHCSPQLDEEEVLTAASSAWRYTEAGDNRFGQHGAYFGADEVACMIMCQDQDAFVLLAFLRAKQGPWSTFMVANGLTEIVGWSRKRLSAARHRLIELGYLTPLRQAGRGHPALYRWADYNSGR